MDYTPLIVDLATLGIIIFFALYCRARGFIRIISGILAIVLAFSTAGFVANNCTLYVSEKYVTPYITESIKPEANTLSVNDSEVTQGKISQLFTNIGISEKIVDDAINDLKTTLSKSVSDTLFELTETVSYKITYAALFVIVFLLSLLIYNLLLKLLNLTAKLPILNFANKALGLLLGLIFGYLAAMAIAYILSKFGIILSDSVIEQTHLLKFIMNFSLISVIALP